MTKIKVPGGPKGSGGKMTYDNPPRWRFDELIFGLGREGLIVDKLVERGYPRIPRTSIVGWRLRNRIPAIWVPVFIQMGLDEKIITGINDLRVQ